MGIAAAGILQTGYPSRHQANSVRTQPMT